MTDKKEIKIRSAEDRADQPRKNVLDLFSDFDPHNYALDGTLTVKNLPEGLFPCFALKTPAEMERLRSQGYRNIEDVQTYLGNTEDGSYTNKNVGESIQIMVCSAEQRKIRNDIDAKKRLEQNKKIYAQDISKQAKDFGDPLNGLPISYDRAKSDLPPPNSYTNDE